jgi:Carboxypeptidase regulatory-like domain
MTMFRTPSPHSVVLTAAMWFGCLSPASAQQQTAPQNQLPNSDFRIAGKVVNGLGGNPLARVRVTIVDTRNRQDSASVISLEEGHFEFSGLPAGKYGLSGQKRGFIAGSYQQHAQFSTAIVTGAGLDTEHLILTLTPFAVLSGKVLDESGEPVRRATVSLYRQDYRVGVERIQRVRNDVTDDQGAYEFSNLNSGTYFLSATGTPWYAVHRAASAPESREDVQNVSASLDVAYPVTYYKDVGDSEEAVPIPIRGGDRLEADLHLTPVPAIHLLFHVPGNPEEGFAMPSLQRPSFDGSEFVPTQGGEMVSPGVFSIDGVAPGEYTVRIAGQGNPVSLNVDATQDGQELDASKGEPVSTVKAVLRVLGEQTLPPDLTVALRNSKFRVIARLQVDSKGEVEFDDLAAGKYEVLVQSPDRAYALERITSDQSDIPDHILNVAAGSSMNVVLSVVGSTLGVEGFAKRNGKPVAGAMIVLVPKDPEKNRSLFRRDQSDMDGSFHLQSVIPGTYTILAIDDGWDLDWASPGVIANYSRHGRGIKVSGNQGVMQLSDPVEVQPK